jgi:hypothetical protein
MQDSISGITAIEQKIYFGMAKLQNTYTRTSMALIKITGIDTASTLAVCSILVI